MSSTTQNAPRVIPAQLGFLAIYNPSLGTNDHDLDNQIVYFSSAETRKRERQERSGTDGKKSKQPSQEEKNERLRQIGLAQGMVEFGKSFSEGKSVNTIETDKSRIILHELESGWWILASIDLTRLPAATKPSSKGATEIANVEIEYSSREVKPSALLLQDLLRAHSTFLLHHASSMSALFVRNQRPKFVSILQRYWNSYLSTWNVMLHGNPAVNVCGGIKLAASGELGVGVGEEDRGSGEREVLEGFVGRIEGLVDLVVSKFGDVAPGAEERGAKDSVSQHKANAKIPWLGTGAEPSSEDGAIFLGVGALSRNSLRDVTHWMEDLYSWGPHAYGVVENPSSTRQARNRKKNSNLPPKPSSPRRSLEDSPTSTLPIRQPSTLSIQHNTNENHASGNGSQDNSNTTGSAPVTANYDLSDGDSAPKGKRTALHRNGSSRSSLFQAESTGDRVLSYFKLGYGTHWSLGLSQKASSSAETPSEQDNGVPPPITSAYLPPSDAKNIRVLPSEGIPDTSMYPKNDSVGHYLVGLLGDIESEESERELDETTAEEGAEEAENRRTLVRTVTVELEREGDARAEADISIDLSSGNSRKTSKRGSSERTNTSQGSYESQDRNKTKKLRIIVYVSRPFIYTFFFELRTESLVLASLYRSLHYQLGPLQKPLLVSTQRQMIRPEISTTNNEDRDTPIYDLLWDPKTLNITSTIPNIPDPSYRRDNEKTWSRIEALNTHTQILNTYAAAKADKTELERTSKTSRGWWVVWTRIPVVESKSPTPPSSKSRTSVSSTPTLKPEYRMYSQQSTGTSISTTKLSGYSGPAHPYLEQSDWQREEVSQDKEIFLIRRASDYVSGRSVSRFVSGSSLSNEGWGSTPAKLAQGIGVDTKRYIEGLLNMNR